MTYIENEKVIRQLRENAVVGELPLPEFELLRISGPFKSTQHFLESSFIEFGQLLNMTSINPGSNVLDYGCGLGRLAIPFSLYLKNGSYLGIDTNLTSLEHCRKTFSGNDKFEFMHVDLYSKVYNKSGKGFSLLESTKLARKFDTGFLFSVFTHVLPENINELLEFIFMALNPGGEMLATFFLLNDRSLAEVNAGRATKKFAFEHNGARTDIEDVPEFAVAYFQDDILKRLASVGFSDPFIIQGAWANAPQQFHKPHQDIMVCRKPGIK